MEAYDHRRIARDNLHNNWGISIAAALIAGLLGGLVSASSSSYDFVIKALQKSGILVYFVLILGSITATLSLAQFILGGVVRQGYCKFLLKQHDRREQPQINDLFSEFDRFGDGFCLNLLQDLYIFLWSLLFVIPGIVASYRYAMAPFIMAENPGMTASEAIRVSKIMMDGHKGELFWLHLTFFGWMLLSALTLGIGNLFLNPYLNAAHASFYRYVSAQYRQPQP